MSLIHANKLQGPVAEGDPLPPGDAISPAPAMPIEGVYRTERPRLLRFLARRSIGEDADDLVQQSFVQVLSKTPDEIKSVRHLEGYLFRVVRNLSIDRARTEQRDRRALHVQLDDIELGMPEHIPSPDQVAALEARDMLNRLEALMQRMKPRTREIFLAHRIDGYSYGEIAARTGLSVKGVEKHMSRAIATIDRGMRHR